MIHLCAGKSFFRPIKTSTTHKPFPIRSLLTKKEKVKQNPLSDSYDVKRVEEGWMEWWLEKKYFHANPSSTNPPFSMVLPPPNVTGSLHLGHTLTVSIQDAIARHKRMSGYDVLWVPGLDHAGIATQSVVERNIMRDFKVTKHQIGREKFLDAVWKWKDKYGGTIIEQLKRTGASLDWNRQVFTMDERLSTAVIEAFIQLFEKKLIYRKTRMVHWCCALQTVISDIEVDALEIEKRTFIKIPGRSLQLEVGVIYDIAFPFAENSKETIIVSTTRPETLFGDIAVAVHPKDSRYQHQIGKMLIHPITGKWIPIISDEHLVDMSLGSGAVKITPAHDLNDFEAFQRYLSSSPSSSSSSSSMEILTVISEKGTLSKLVDELCKGDSLHSSILQTLNISKWEGINRFDARHHVLQFLEEKGRLLHNNSKAFYQGKRDHKMRLNICSRSGDIIEPLLLPQWYVATKEMAKSSIDLIQNRVSSNNNNNKDNHNIGFEILPSDYETEWIRWLSNNQDWCISRQLWWGHRIPAYQIYLQSSTSSSSQDPQLRLYSDQWIVASSPSEANQKAVQLFPELSNSSFTLIQDEDVLDTWFSSGLFPLSALGWPFNDNQKSNNNNNNSSSSSSSSKEKSVENLIPKYYPLSLMETGGDILFFWVSRMTMLCKVLYPSFPSPFSKVLLHPLVRDSKGRKMSKSLGNVIDPLHVIQGCSLQQLLDELKSGNITDKNELQRAENSLKEEFRNGIPECGTDALRFSLCNYSIQGRSINLELSQVHTIRRFLNKIWNASKFVTSFLDSKNFPFHQFDTCSIFTPASLLHHITSSIITTTATTTSTNPIVVMSPADQWILSRLYSTIENCEKGMNSYELHRATSSLYQFFLHDFCDVYLELCKHIFYNKLELSLDQLQIRQKTQQLILFLCLETTLRLMHPFMPFITEELWQHLPSSKNSLESIVISPFPQSLTFQAFYDMPLQNNFQIFLDLLSAARALKKENSLHKDALVSFHVINTGDSSFLSLMIPHLRIMLKADVFIVGSQHHHHDPLATTIVNDSVKIAMILTESTLSSATTTTTNETKSGNLSKKKEKLEQHLLKLEQNIRDENYQKEAASSVKEKDLQKIKKLKQELEELRKQTEKQ